MSLQFSLDTHKENHLTKHVEDNSFTVKAEAVKRKGIMFCENKHGSIWISKPGIFRHRVRNCPICEKCKSTESETKIRATVISAVYCKEQPEIRTSRPGIFRERVVRDSEKRVRRKTSWNQIRSLWRRKDKVINKDNTIELQTPLYSGKNVSTPFIKVGSLDKVQSAQEIKFVNLSNVSFPVSINEKDTHDIVNGEAKINYINEASDDTVFCKDHPKLWIKRKGCLRKAVVRNCPSCGKKFFKNVILRGLDII